MRMKKIHLQLKRIFHAFIIILSCVVVGFLVYMYASDTLRHNVELSLTEIAKQGEAIVERELDKRHSILETIARMDKIQDPNLPVEEKLQDIESYFSTSDFLRMSIADTSGYSKTSDNEELYVGDRAYFQQAMHGNRGLSDPLISRVDGTMVLAFSVPIEHSGRIIGVLYASYPIEALSSITDEIEWGENGYSFITNYDGQIIAHKNRSLIYENQDDLFNEDFITQIHTKQYGTGEYTYEGKNNVVAFASIEGTNWSFEVAAPESMVFESTDVILHFILLALGVICIIFVTLRIYLLFLQNNLKKEKHLSENAIDAAEIMIILVAPDGTILDVNRHTEEKIGCKKENLVGKQNFYELIKTTCLKKAKNLLESFDQKSQKNIELALKKKEGGFIYGLWNIGDAEDTQGGLNLIGVDITERVESQKALQRQHEELTAVYEEISASEEELKTQFDQLSYQQEQLRLSQERYKLIINISEIGIWDWDIGMNESYYSRTWYSLFGLDAGTDLKVMDWIQYIYPKDRRQIENMIKNHINNKVPLYQDEIRITTAKGEEKWIHIKGKALWDLEGKPYRFAMAFTDKTDQKQYEEKIKRYAYYDNLTGLPNRIRLIQQFQYISATNRHMALLFMDLDNFKLINDTYGHNMGDLLLQEVGKRLYSMKGYEYLVSRYGGDEFVVVLNNVRDKKDVEEYSNELIRLLNKSYIIKGIQLHITFSIGIVLFPQHGETFEDLLKHADTAMYKGKELGKNQYIFFSKEMNESAVKKMTMQNALRPALENKEFQLYYQPQINVHTNEVIGFEALLRWIHPDLGMVSPNDFIPLAEETHVIIPLGQWVLERAVKFIKSLNQRMGKAYTISVNISILQLLQDDFVPLVLKTIEKEGLPSGLLELELTETILMQSFDLVVDKLKKLQDAGVNIALDDFGKGYSSLSYLRKLPLSTLKIDKTFIDYIEILGERDYLTGAIVHIGKNMGLSIVAEGVETKKQLEYLYTHHCDRIQGYYYSRPIPEQEVPQYIEAQE